MNVSNAVTNEHVWSALGSAAQAGLEYVRKGDKATAYATGVQQGLIAGAVIGVTSVAVGYQIRKMEEESNDD
jgi:hypothetical protein